MKNNEKNVLVIGGLGAIGSNLCKKLVSTGKKVLVLDNYSSSGMYNHAELRELGINIEYCDIRDLPKLEKIMVTFDPYAIYNLAAHFANQNSVDFPIQDIEINIVGLVNTLEVSKKLSNLKKYLYTSSSCVYGSDTNMIETSCVEPYDTPYAINKYVGELYCKYYSEQFNLPTVVVRVFNTFGPGEMPGDYRNVIPNFIKRAIKCESLYITGSGLETRDFTYIDDTIDCLILAEQSRFSTGEVFNSGTGMATKIKDLAILIIEITNSKSEIVNVDKRDWDSVSHRLSSIDNTSTNLGYTPKSTLREGIIETYKWLKDKV